MNVQLMLDADVQRSNEYKFSRKQIDKYLTDVVEQDYAHKVEQGVTLLQEWSQSEHDPIKTDLIQQLLLLDLTKVVTEAIVHTAYCQIPDKFSGVVGGFAARLGFTDRVEGIMIASSLLAVLCNTDAFDITQSEETGDLSLQSKIELSEQLQLFIAHSRYLPPMVCLPKKLKRNNDSAYLTAKSSLILGRGNYHEGDISLDVLNKQNAIPLCLNTDFLSTVEEEPTFAISDPEKRERWLYYKATCYEVYTLLAKQGNRFYLTNKVDKRGRMYAQGYHVTTQGTAFKKASVDLAEQEVVTGVPGL